MVEYIDAINYFFTVITVIISIAWSSLIRTIFVSFRNTPYLDIFENNKLQKSHKVSIILPARNEEKFIGECIKSLLKQDYKNYEILVVDDSSDDSTAKIIKKYSKNEPKILYVQARKKPSNWIGKNWACVEGYKKSSGDILLFTDADTKHNETIISLSVSHLLSLKLDALTVIPKIICIDNWTRITLPILSVFLHTKFSAVNVNNTTKKIGYFFGSFFVIKRDVYKSIGTHQNVKHEIVEDGALGRIVKDNGYRLRMVRGEHLLHAVWARDIDTLWNALKRLVISVHIQNRYYVIGIFFALLFLTIVPFLFVIYSLIFISNSSIILSISSITSIVIIYYAIYIEIKKYQTELLPYCLLVPIGGLLIIASFFYVIINTNRSLLSWKNRTYSTKNNVIGENDLI